MSPTFFDFFKSFYYVNTYLPSIDVSDDALSKHLMERENLEVAKIAQRLISQPQVQQVLSDPINYNRIKREKMKKILTEHGFRLLSNFKPIVEHKELPGWIIKSGANTCPRDVFIKGPSNDKNELSFPSSENGLLRIEMANRLAKIAKEENIEVVLPKKKLVSYENAKNIADPTRKYCILSEKLNTLSEQDTVGIIKKMDGLHQRELARKISTLIQKSGWVDAAPRNIRFTTEGKLAILDTEPFSLMVSKKFPFFSNEPPSIRSSVEKCARIGLFTLLEAVSQKNPDKSILESSSLPGLEEFHKQLKSDYEEIAFSQLSYWKITCSVLSLGLFPLVHAITAFSNSIFAKKTSEEIQKMKKAYQVQVKKYFDECERNLEGKEFVQEHKKQLFLKANPFFSCIEGVPF